MEQNVSDKTDGREEVCGKFIFVWNKVGQSRSRAAALAVIDAKAMQLHHGDYGLPGNPYRRGKPQERFLI